MIPVVVSSERSDTLSRLRSVCVSQGLSGLAERLARLATVVEGDMDVLEQQLSALRLDSTVVHRSASHLVDLGGKRLRPLCLLLAAKIGDQACLPAGELAIAVELVHSATLLHDDVVDAGEHRRGAPTARALYGNAASVFAGDWLLVEALRRVHTCKVGDLLSRLLDTIDQMIAAEAIQLQNRGHVRACRATYLQVVEGKTASLFRWALYAGGRAGGLGESACESLEEFGHHLGVAFQVVDDLLDYDGDTRSIGKDVFADLREGKVTYPLIVALERDQRVRDTLEAFVRNGHGSEHADALRSQLLADITRTDAVADCRAFATDRADRALNALGTLPAGYGRDALATVAEALVHRGM